MAEVFLCERGQLTIASKRDLRAAGVVVVEVSEIGKAHFIRASEIVSADDMLWATLDALCHKGGYGDSGTVQREKLSANLLKIVLEARVRTAVKEDVK